MKKRLIALVAICACALCIGLVGCGGGGDATKNFVGTWEFSGGTMGGETMSADDVELLNSMGAITITIKEDGTGVMSLMGEETEGKWKAKDANTITLDIDGSGGDLKLVDGKMILEDGTDTMEFTKK